MRLIDLLIAVLIRQLFTALHRLHGLLCKFIDIHTPFPFLLRNRVSVLCSMRTITHIISSVKSRVLIFLQNPLYADTRRPERFQQVGVKEIIYFLSPNALMVLAVNVPS